MLNLSFSYLLTPRGDDREAAWHDRVEAEQFRVMNEAYEAQLAAEAARGPRPCEAGSASFDAALECGCVSCTGYTECYGELHDVIEDDLLDDWLRQERRIPDLDDDQAYFAWLCDRGVA